LLCNRTFYALDKKSPEERAGFLDGACGKNPARRARVEALLADHFQAATFMKKPAVEGERPTIAFEAADAPDESVGQRLGRYKLLEKIGEGGCGVVYVAEQTEPVRRRVALKVIKLGMDTKAVVARFEAERQALAMMDHPNIAKVLDAGTTETGRPFFVMELVRGVRITDYCDQNNLSTKERLGLFIMVCQAIQHAHQKGIIHRDIKPSNILVTLHDGEPVPKVIDFGIAKATEGRLTDATVYTQLHQFIGTPAYMSPEQAEMSGLDIDTRSDIYSLGVLLYELLAGSTPFDAKELMAAGIDAMRKTIREKEPPRPSTRFATLKGDDLTTAARRRSADTSKLLHQLKGDLDWIVMKCLEKDRTRRYETAIGLARDIERYLGSEPVVARPASGFYRFQKMVRRNKIVFGAGAAVGAAVLAGLAVSTYLFVQERQAHGRALAAEKAQSNLRIEAQAESKKAKSEAARAEAAATEVKLTLAASDFSLAVRLVEENQKIDALAYLARSLSLNPANEAVSTRLATLLASQPWWVPVLVVKPGAGVASARFSPDGKRIVTTLGLGAAQVWDAESGRPLTGLMKPAGIEITAAQFTPDGKRILTASPDGTWRVWDAESGQPLAEPVTKPRPGAFWTAQFSPDGERILASSMSGAVAVWDTASGKLLSELKSVPRAQVARFSPDGKQILTTSIDQTAQLWDTQTGQPINDPLKQIGIVFSIQFSPDGKRIVTASMGGTARVSDTRGQPLTDPLKHDGGVCSAEFSPDGKRIVTASIDGAARVWDAQSGQPLTEPLKHGDAALAAQFSPDGKRILTLSGESFYVWATIGGPALAESFKTDAYSKFSPDGRRFLAARSIKGELAARVWDTQSGQPWGAPFKPNASMLVSLPIAQFSPDGGQVVIISDDNTARIWDGRTGQPVTGPLQHGRGVNSAQFSPDGTRVVTASSDETARVWDARSGQPLASPLRHGSAVSFAQFSPDGERIVTASADHYARVWDARSGRQTAGPLKHGGAVNLAQFSPDGKRVATASADSTARVWDAQTGQSLVGPLKHSFSVSSVQFSKDGKRLVTGSWDGTARVWDAQTGQPLTGPLRQGGSVSSAQFSPDGKRIVTASWDHFARVWDAASGQPLTEPLKHGNMVLAAQFSADGRRILTTAVSDAARVWEIAPDVARLPDWLPRLAEIVSGQGLNNQGMLEQTKLNRGEALSELRRKLNAAPDEDDWAQWGRWFLADPATRTISPLSRATIPE
jgi:WD40 repeat protein/tRNA A-37 threonylcarbamoyl transferase component Bud32